MDHASEKFILYLKDAEHETVSEENCWRRKIEKEFGLQVLNFDYYSFPDSFVSFGKKAQHRRTGRAMTSCALKAESDHIMFLEEDWEVIARPKELVMHRIEESQKLLEIQNPENFSEENTNEQNQQVDMVHLRHKYFYGQPYYELLTSSQHNEPPPVSLALYFNEDPVEEQFPLNAWSPPFNEGGDVCDSGRASWYESLKYQITAVEEIRKNNSQKEVVDTYEQFIDEHGEQKEIHPETKISLLPKTLSASESGTRLPKFDWCNKNSASICTSSRADDDPFRNVFYTTNPTLYRRKFWVEHFAAQVAVLGDARAVEESITVSYQWRVNPGYRVAYSPGLFRHKRVDRDTHLEVDSAECGEMRKRWKDEVFEQEENSSRGESGKNSENSMSGRIHQSDNKDNAWDEPYYKYWAEPEVAENRENRRLEIEEFYGGTQTREE